MLSKGTFPFLTGREAERLQYRHIVSGRFVDRPNRFIAHVKVKDSVETVHVKNTGRCRELLLPNSRVYLAESENPARKTRYDLVAVEKERVGQEPLLVNMDSQIPNELAAEWLKGGLFSQNARIRREVTFQSSRFDFYIEDGARRIFLEVKGVTLERDGMAYFPDAPTERGVKHVTELIKCLEEGYEGHILFVVQMKGVKGFCPNDSMHQAFGEALRLAAAKGVRITAVDCRVTPEGLLIDEALPIFLNDPCL